MAMHRAESSINNIIDTFGQQHIDSETLDTIKIFIYECSYEEALWGIMESLEEIIEATEPLLLLLDESWKLLCNYHEQRVERERNAHKECIHLFGRNEKLRLGFDNLLREAERDAELCKQGLRRVSDYPNHTENSLLYPIEPAGVPSILVHETPQRKHTLKIKAE